MAHSGRINNRDHNGDMAAQEDGLVYVWLWRSIPSQGLLLYYTLLCLLENHTDLHCDVHLRAELCVPETQLASARGGIGPISPRPACVYV